MLQSSQTNTLTSSFSSVDTHISLSVPTVRDTIQKHIFWALKRKHIQTSHDFKLFLPFNHPSLWKALTEYHSSSPAAHLCICMTPYSKQWLVGYCPLECLTSYAPEGPSLIFITFTVLFVSHYTSLLSSKTTPFSAQFRSETFTSLDIVNKPIWKVSNSNKVKIKNTCEIALFHTIYYFLSMNFIVQDHFWKNSRVLHFLKPINS